MGGDTDLCGVCGRSILWHDHTTGHQFAPRQNERDRLQAENDRLREQLAARDEALRRLAKAVVDARLVTMTPPDLRNGAVLDELLALDRNARAAMGKGVV